MRFTLIVLYTLVFTVAAQNYAEFSPCAQQCLLDGVVHCGNDVSVLDCACGAQAAQTAANTCFSSSCSPEDSSIQITALSGVCDAKRSGGFGSGNGGPSSSSTPRPSGTQISIGPSTTVTPPDAASHVGAGVGAILAAAGLVLAL